MESGGTGWVEEQLDVGKLEEATEDGAVLGSGERLLAEEGRGV